MTRSELNPYKMGIERCPGSVQRFARYWCSIMFHLLRNAGEGIMWNNVCVAFLPQCYRSTNEVKSRTQKPAVDRELPPETHVWNSTICAMVKTKYMAYGHPWELKFHQWYIQLLSIVLISNCGIHHMSPKYMAYIQFYPMRCMFYPILSLWNWWERHSKMGKINPRKIGNIPMKARFLTLKFQEVRTIMRYRQTLAAWLPSNWEYGDS